MRTRLVDLKLPTFPSLNQLSSVLNKKAVVTTHPVMMMNGGKASIAISK